MGKFFICYRRDDTGDYAGRIADKLREALSADCVFMDTDNVRIGARWTQELQSALKDSMAVLVVIGSKWLTVEREGLPRLRHQDDWVRAEIRLALDTDKQIVPIVPKIEFMPEAESLPEDICRLAEWSALEIRTGNFQKDCAALVEWAQGIAVPKVEPAVLANAQRTRPTRRRWLQLLLASVSVAALAALLLWFSFGHRTLSTVTVTPRPPREVPPANANVIKLSGSADCVSSEPLRVTFFDVGQGDATLFQLGNLDVLLDGGPPHSVSKFRKVIASPLEYLFISHAHIDHYGSAIDLLQSTPVERVFSNAGGSTSMSWQQFERAVKLHGLTIEKLPKGERLELSRALMMVVLSSTEGIEGWDLNDTSLVQRFDYCNVRILMTGDIEARAQERLMADYCHGNQCPELKADVLKFPHHGLDHFLPKFLDAVKPSHAVISAGAFSLYKAPGARTIEALKAHNIEIHSTSGEDEQNIELRIEGGKSGGFLYYDRDAETWKREGGE